MVTKIIVRIPLEVEGRGRASASNSNRGGDLQNSKQGDGDDNADDSKGKEADEEGNLLTDTLDIACHSHSTDALPFAPKNGKKYTQWEILSLSAHFAKKVIVRKVQESDYGPSRATIHRWFPNEKDNVFNEDEIRKLLFFDTIGSPDWYTKIEILSNSGFAPPKDVMLAMFRVNTDKRKQESCVDDARERYLYLFQQQQQQHDAQQQLPPSPPPPQPPQKIWS